ncbi:uncharacterized protein LOC115261819 [Aedes albopictus]|uniref:Secreted protein n=1 Tax=Aedes albopictus TaxID=7160 RepID=A0ABM1ZUL9_AEDAL|nr:uncharacterized protein LOC109413475 [Aedes albopictus]
MEEEVKHLPETTGKSDREWQKMIGFNGPLKNFRFVLGERSLLKVISNIVEKQGISKFTKKLIKQDSLGKSESAPETQTELSVRQKVIEFYTKKCSSGSNTETYFFDQIASMKVDISCDEAGTRAVLKCPFCETIVTIRMEKSGSWKISNFSSHVRVKHAEYDIPGDIISQQPKKRPCDNHLETTPEDTPWTAMETHEAYETEYLEISQQSCSQTSTVAAVLTNENDREVRRTCEDGPPTYVLQHLVVKRMKYEGSDPLADDEGNQCSSNGSDNPSN